ncbi:ribosome maturation factor RimM [Caldinitratiruptor microaerophilus]|uniref:Ribosome maturation factor RimM n=1 Tax=Caldinitratiruptor microaerophilus TaxID=671077 RepID=A0AA35CJU8_9FIRM|nr:ribosome maturation factor RimM [Caldinitratiruptor microaerophilus]BDG60600.1 ribosome maturation factor RimM [Caldinitratiruptor microaerophilus]
MTGSRVTIGQIVAPQGLRGAVRVYPLTDFPERWPALREVYVGDEPRPRRCRFVGFVRAGMPVLELEGVHDRSAAETLRGRELRVDAAALHPLPEDTFYVFQLVGMVAEDPEGTRLGRVEAVEPAPAADVLVIRLEAGHRARVPFVRQFVERVDPAAGRVVIRPIPGLLEP